MPLNAKNADSNIEDRFSAKFYNVTQRQINFFIFHFLLQAKVR